MFDRKVWDGTAWVPLAGLPSGLYVQDATPLSPSEGDHWYHDGIVQQLLNGEWQTKTWLVQYEDWGGSGVSVGPGDGGGTTMVKGLMPTGATYMEVEMYLTGGSGLNWAAVRLNSPSSAALYDSNAYGWLVRWDDISAATFSGSDGSNIAVSPSPRVANPLLLGMEKVSSTSYKIYFNGVLTDTVTGATPQAGTYWQLGSYNGVTTHYDRLSFYSQKP